jgi:cysteinyl-tRNA synthetase
VEADTQVNWQQDEEFGSRFKEAMDDDFNTALALSIVADVRQALNKAQEATDQDRQIYFAGLLLSMGNVLGLFQQDADTFFSGKTDESEAEIIEALISKRNQARVDKNWAVADQVRDELTAMGIVLEDAAGKTTWRKV